MSTHRRPFLDRKSLSVIGAAVAAATVLCVPRAAAEGWEASASNRYAAAAAAAATSAKSARADSPLKNLHTPVLKTIAPDSAPAALSLPEGRGVVDQMLQSHEFTFGRNRKASNFAGERRAFSTGSNVELDAVKLRISRDKVILKAEWTFN